MTLTGLLYGVEFKNRPELRGDFRCGLKRQQAIHALHKSIRVFKSSLLG